MTDRAKPPRLGARWSKRERDILFTWDAMPGGSSNGHLLHNVLSPLAKELEARGFDLATMRFSIRKKAAQ